MDQLHPFSLFVGWLPRILLGVTGFLIGTVVGDQLVKHVLPIIRKRQANFREAMGIRLFSSLGFSLFCFLMAGQIGLGGPGGLGAGGIRNLDTLTGDVSSEIKQDKKSMVKESSQKQPSILKMRILSPEVALQYSGEAFVEGQLFWFSLDKSLDQSGLSKLLDLKEAQGRILAWKKNQPTGNPLKVAYLYARQDPDTSSPLAEQVTRWASEQDITFLREPVAEGLP